MKREEFEQMYAAEDRLWWYRSLRDHVVASLNLDQQHGQSRRCGSSMPVAAPVGCRRGCDPYGTVVGIDLAPFAIAVCRERRALANTAVASITELPFPDAAFDLAVSLDVISDAGTGNDAVALAELARVLRPGGRLCLNLPAFRWLAGEHDVAVETKRRYTRAELLPLLAAGRFPPRAPDLLELLPPARCRRYARPLAPARPRCHHRALRRYRTRRADQRHPPCDHPTGRPPPASHRPADRFIAALRRAAGIGIVGSRQSAVAGVAYGTASAITANHYGLPTTD